MHYYLIIALQAYCIYHAFKYKNNTYWFFIIFFVPIIGSIIYLITQVFSKRDLEIVQDGLTAIINPTKKVIELKKRLDFSETFQNKVNLADAYFEIHDYQNAITYYKEAIDSNFSSDTYVISKLVDAYFYMEDYKNATKHFNDLEEFNDAIKPTNQLHYGLALEKLENPKMAKKQLKKLDINFSNY